MTRRVIVASGNAHKVVELRAMIQGVGPGWEVVGLSSFSGAPEIAETADTFAGNATLKAEGIAAWLREQGEAGESWVLADDSGLCVDALEGAPGVWSARFAGPGASDADNNRRLVSELAARGLSESAAHYVCVLAWTRVDGRELRRFQGRWDVVVRTTPRGDGGFGYDPHAYLGPGGPSVAELDAATKAAVSHRGAAMRALCEWLAGSPGTGGAFETEQ